MIRKLAIAAALLASLSGSPAAFAQSQQDDLDARYDRALAAGYKALFLCSAIANAERGGVTRSAESVHQWELTGIQSPLDQIVQDLPYDIMRADNGTGVLSFVRVTWAQDMPPRIAYHKTQNGCSLGPIGMEEPPKRDVLPRSYPDAIVNDHSRIIPKNLTGVFEGAFSQKYGNGARTTAVIVSGKEGDGVWRYANGFGPATPQRTWSVAKSIAATLVGTAVHDGAASGQSSAGVGTDEDDPRRAITIDHMLRMASGRYSDTPGNRTDPIYWGGAIVGERAAAWPIVHQPGTVFRYANNDTLMAVKAVEAYLATHPPSDFFEKIGMHNTVAETDHEGNYILSSQVWSTAPDLMRLGQLYLNDGVWNGERILPENWREYVSTASGPQPEGRPIGYGAGFWLFNASDGIPPDTFAAMGNRGQYVVIVPSRDIVIVRRGEDPAGHGFDIVSFTRDVLAAMGK
ncbi:serine hydrolase domain-containing protein [Pontixanthobacter aquaemixtae]|uniref:Serine hydrolase n=1 Tax=Pontixanthobacter aquaemixtae TaxID=1958940 RepID=A0A844ZT09_9SPHN|nr:serine hydrolase [Pontixanthobacter aquaemixtae]MXO90614.1 serine hydrolase [Pontixanthobacter aquaemixtae]